jgi:hypothetical protein
MAQVVELLPSKHKVLDLILSTMLEEGCYKI